MGTRRDRFGVLAVAVFLLRGRGGSGGVGGARLWRVVAWNDLGMHCVDGRLLGLLPSAALQQHPRAAHRRKDAASTIDRGRGPRDLRGGR